VLVSSKIRHARLESRYLQWRSALLFGTRNTSCIEKGVLHMQHDRFWYTAALERMQLGWNAWPQGSTVED
jgi:hypothetical protein